MEKFKSQYIITSNQLVSKVDLNWEKEEFQEFSLHTAPNLNKYVHIRGKNKIVLIGFAFHVLYSDKDEQSIINDISIEEDMFLNDLDCLCGNFLILFERDRELTLYNDAAAVMKMFYLVEKKKIQSVASDPKLLQQLTQLKHDQDDRSLEFYNGQFFSKYLIRLGEKTSYQNVFQVLPNHLINVTSFRVERFFPRESMEKLSIENSTARIHQYFTNVVEAASRRYNLKCSLTAGWDSRMVAAMTLKHKEKVDYYTFIHPGYNNKHHDIKIPKKIAKELGLNHKIISKNEMISKESQENAKASFDLLPKENFQNIMGGYSWFSEKQDLVLIGSVSEICKNYFDEVNIVDGKSLAQAAHFPLMPYTISYFQSKYYEMNALCKKYGYDIRDLVHWEQDITNFAAKRTLYMSFITKAFSPFNSRLIINTILSAPRKSRDKHLHPYYKKYLKQFHPELTIFPINPTSRKRLMVAGKKLGIYSTYKKISTKLRK